MSLSGYMCERGALLICLQKELWLRGLNQSDLDKSKMKKRVSAATETLSDSMSMGVISHRPIIPSPVSHHKIYVHSFTRAICVYRHKAPDDMIV